MGFAGLVETLDIDRSTQLVSLLGRNVGIEIAQLVIILVTFPLLRPAMVPAIMLGFIWTFNQFNVIFFISEGGPLGLTEILVTQAYKLVAENQLYGVASAFAVIVFFILLVITLIQNRVTRATEAADA